MDKLEIVVRIDRMYGYDSNSHDDGSDLQGTRRYVMKSHKSPAEWYGDITSQLLEDMGEVKMGDPQELKSFITYTKKKFPADHYGLILRNHGFGVRSRGDSGDSSVLKNICLDETDGDDSLFIGEITGILTDAEKKIMFLSYFSEYFSIYMVSVFFIISPFI